MCSRVAVVMASEVRAVVEELALSLTAHRKQYGGTDSRFFFPAILNAV